MLKQRLVSTANNLAALGMPCHRQGIPLLRSQSAATSRLAADSGGPCPLMQRSNLPLLRYAPFVLRARKSTMRWSVPMRERPSRLRSVQDLQTSKGDLGSPMNQNRLPTIRLLRCPKRPRSLLRQLTTHRSNARASQNASDRTWPWRLQGQRRLWRLLRRVVHRPHLSDAHRPRVLRWFWALHAPSKPGCGPRAKLRRWTRLRRNSKQAGSRGRRGRGWRSLRQSRDTDLMVPASEPQQTNAP